MSRIELHHIDKFYGKNHVLKDLNLIVEDGAFMTLLGPSGCGKTTTLRVVAGLEKPQNGIMTIDGTEMINADDGYYTEPAKRGLNLVFQSYALWPHMTVYENVAYGLKIKKMPKSEVDAKVKHALDMMRIGEFEKRYPSELSGGQQQRVAIARAVASDPKVLLLDEPLSNLDAKLRIDMRAELKRMHLDMGTTIIYVTHDQVEALTMSTKIALFSQGVLAQVATPMQLYMNPVNLTCADFIGNPRINLIKGVAELVGETLKVQSGLGEFDFPKKDMTDAKTPSGKFECFVAFRPEQLTINRENVPGSIPATVYANQPAGSETLVTIRCGKNNEDEFLVKCIGIQEYDMNATVYLTMDINSFNVYDKASEQLIKYSV